MDPRRQPSASSTAPHPADTVLAGEQRIVLPVGAQRMLPSGTRYRIGLPTIFARWGQTLATVGDRVPLVIRAEGFTDGTQLKVEVLEHDADGEHDPLPEAFGSKLEGVVKSGRLELVWSYKYVEDQDERYERFKASDGRVYHPPEYLFRVFHDGRHTDSDILRYRPFLAGAFGAAASHRGFKVRDRDGAVLREGRLDGRGTFRLQDLDPNRHTVELLPATPPPGPPVAPLARIPLREAVAPRARWGAPEALCGQQVSLEVEGLQVEDGVPVRFEVFAIDRPAEVLATLEGTAAGGQAYAHWTWSYEGDGEWTEAKARAYRWPEHAFVAKAGVRRARSGNLKFFDRFQATLVDRDGQPVTEEGIGYALRLADGALREGTLAAGRVEVERVPPGPCQLRLRPAKAKPLAPAERRQLVKARWGSEFARCGEEVTLSAEAQGLPDGTAVTFAIRERDTTSADDAVETLSATLSGGRAETRWTYRYLEDRDDAPEPEEEARGYTLPEYYFVAEAEATTAVSALLRFRDTFEVELVDEQGRPVTGATGLRYGLVLPDGSEREGVLSGSKLRFDDVPPGPCRLVLRSAAGAAKS